jgi:hypothetical protein
MENIENSDEFLKLTYTPNPTMSYEEMTSFFNVKFSLLSEHAKN